MIAALTGTVRERWARSLLLDVHGVGYEVAVTSATLDALIPGTETSLYISFHQRDQGPTLYGFRTREEREFFELLQTVSGVGPKAALGILGVGPVADLQRNIASGDVTLLTRVSGVGKKTAERLVVELKEKLESGAVGPVSTDAGHVIDALVRLGYSAREAREALQGVDRSLPVEAQVRAALGSLGQRG